MTRKSLTLVLVVAATPLLQACFPLAVTGVGATALVASDRRTTGTYIEDETIDWKSIARLGSEFQTSHITATSYNRRVLLTGEAPDEATKKKIEDVIRGVPNVRDVVNELQIAGASSYTSRGNDALVTSNVKARMVNNARFSPTSVKVVTEAGVVYLMGLVTQEEGEAAAEVTRTTSGVNRVVKVFEYVGNK